MATSPGKSSELAGTLAVIAEAVLEDHAELDRAVLGLRGMCAVLRAGHAPGSGEPAGLIEDFEAQLVLHFAAEEAEEFFGSLVTDEPRLLQRVEALQDEHGRMAEAVGQLLESAKSGAPGPEMAERITRFLGWFTAHEHAENALMQEFLLLDRRGSD